MVTTTNRTEKPSKIQFLTPDPNDFDWDNEGKTFDTDKVGDSANLESLYNTTLNHILEQQIVIGTVIGLTSKEAVINIGYKSDGMVPLSEFRHMPDLKVGDQVEVYVET